MNRIFYLSYKSSFEIRYIVNVILELHVNRMVINDKNRSFRLLFWFL